RHPPALHPGRALGVATRRGLPDELRRGAEARRGAGAGWPGHQRAPRTGAASAHQHRRRTPSAAGPRPARDGLARASAQDVRPACGGRTQMSVTNVTRDLDNLTLTLFADFDAPIERVWQLWADPRQLERWWGPPTYPSTVEQHDLTPGGEVTYYMTGPEGEKHRGWWRITSVNPPKSLEFTDGFADQDGTPIAHMPISTVHM